MASEVSEKGVVLLGMWASMFGMRARIALEEKGIEYEYREEDLANKSETLLRLNPVHKKIPVLVHDGRTVCESLVILHYIDEVWPAAPSKLLPSDPFARAHARFWADFIDKKVYNAGVNLWKAKGEEAMAEAKNEFIEVMKLLENELGEKSYFGGEVFGFLDIALAGYVPWFGTYELSGGFSMEVELPKLAGWVKRCKERESALKVFPDSEKVNEFLNFLKAKYFL
ncbi:glutathione S-transferase U25-like [Wolffia australiana]